MQMIELPIAVVCFLFVGAIIGIDHLFNKRSERKRTEEKRIQDIERDVSNLKRDVESIERKIK